MAQSSVACQAVLRLFGTGSESYVYLLDYQQGDLSWKVRISTEDFLHLSDHLMRSYVFLPEIHREKLASEDEKLSLEYATDYLTAIQTRDDVLSDPTFYSLMKTQPRSRAQLRLTGEVTCHHVFQASCLSVLEGNSAAVVGVEDREPKSVWDFLLRPARGGYAVVPIQGDLIRPPTFFELPEGVTGCVSLNSSDLILSLASGSLLWTRLSYSDFYESKEVASVQAHTDRIAAIATCRGVIASVGADNTLKVLTLQQGKLSVISGGSLRSRLQPASVRALAFDPSGEKLYIGTSINRVLIYGLKAEALVYVESISTRGVGPIFSLEVDRGNVMVSDGEAILVWTNARQATLVTFI